MNQEKIFTKAIQCAITQPKGLVLKIGEVFESNKDLWNERDVASKLARYVMSTTGDSVLAQSTQTGKRRFSTVTNYNLWALQPLYKRLSKQFFKLN